jgi:hypothetical protein
MKIGGGREAFLLYFCISCTCSVSSIAAISNPFQNCVSLRPPERSRLKLCSIALWPSSFAPRGGLHVGIVPALPPVLSREFIIESFLQDTIRATLYVFVLYFYFVSSRRYRVCCITYVCLRLTLRTSYTSTPARSIPIYIHAQDVHSLVLAILTPGRGGLHRR